MQKETFHKKHFQNIKKYYLQRRKFEKKIHKDISRRHFKKTFQEGIQK
jgi:hypothetical protein